MRNINITTIEGLKMVNTTPHPINFLSEKTGEEYQVEPSGFILNATPVEEVIQNESVTYVKTVFKPTEDGIEFLSSLSLDVIVVGSMIACQCYDRACAMTPAKGFERVPPAQKKMNLFKFTI
ncbi:MAG: hypothetical protein M0R03_03900 [Novosphingobium sp.]|nr:hypothetical protein [Novosphingobium sp.]